jgi:hypothetical protein
MGWGSAKREVTQGPKMQQVPSYFRFVCWWTVQGGGADGAMCPPGVGGEPERAPCSVVLVEAHDKVPLMMCCGL